MAADGVTGCPMGLRPRLPRQPHPGMRRGASGSGRIRLLANRQDSCRPKIVWYPRLNQHRFRAGGVMTGRLTERQLECLRLSATMTDKDIGRHLGISHHTVSLHIREAMRRLQVSSRKAALRRLASEPLYGSEAIPAPLDPGPDRPAPGDPVDDTVGTVGTSTAWLLPPPPRPRARLVLIFVFAAVAALITVGIVNVVSGAVGALAPHAPPNAVLTPD